MARHSINMLDSANYRAIKVPQEDGSQIDGIAYFAPAAEHDHLAPGLARAQERMQEVMLRNQLAEALEDPGKSTAALIDQGVSLARRAQEDGIEQPDFDRSLEIAAALLLRDGNAKQRKAHARWARKQCTTATRGSEDPAHRFRTGLRFNPMGIGTLGLVHATLHNKARLAVRGLLELAVRGDPAVAHGFAAARDALNQIDPKLPVLSCGALSTGLFAPAFGIMIHSQTMRHDGSMLSPAQRGRSTQNLHLYVAKPMSRNGHFSRSRTRGRARNST